MSLVVAFFGLFVAALGVVGVLSPRWLLGLVTRVQSQPGLYVIAGIRLLLGIALLLSAGSSRAPLYLQILGVLSLVSGAITPFFGLERFKAILTWWSRRPVRLVRIWSGFVVLFGLSLVWAVERAA